jgi:hypothetical protein
MLLSNVLFIIGRDSQGGYWLTGLTSTKHWAKIDQAITQIGDTQTWEL